MSFLLQASQAITFPISFPCDLAEVRPATLAVRHFLAEQGLHEEELMTWELATAEACNNAVLYATPEGRSKRVKLTALSSESHVELRVNDHTAGFNWPELIELPPDESVGGRGLFIIQSLMDQASYFRGQGENTLVLRKNRIYHEHRQSADLLNLEEARSKLAESKHVIRHMAKELCFRSEKLSAIFRCSAELGRTDDLQDFARRLLNDMLHITSADWFVLRLTPKNETLLLPYITSQAGMDLQPLVIGDTHPPHASVEVEAAFTRCEIQLDPHRVLNPFDPLKGMGSNSIGLVRPLHFGQTLIGTLALGKNTVHSPLTEAQLTAARTLADLLTIQIASARLQEEVQEIQVNSRLISHELEIARNIQRTLLPKSLPKFQGFGLDGFCESARQIGGDFYDVLQISEDSLLLMVADVMGKGVPAAMFAAILLRLIRSMSEMAARPSELLTRVNRLMYEELSSVDMFITAQLVFVDLQKRQLITANAGHCPALLAGMDENRVQTLSPEGMPLGISPVTTFESEAAHLGKRSRIFLYTDGVAEAQNPAGESFGQTRLMDWLKHSAERNETAEQLKLDLAKQLASFQSNTALKDDQTFLILAEEGALNGHSQAL